MSQGTPVRFVNTMGVDSSINIDAFGRLRVSNPYSLQDHKHLFGSNTYLWTEKTTGSGIITPLVNQSSVVLSVNNTAGSAIHQTKHCAVYQPGKSQLMLFTTVMGISGTGITKRVGYFDEKNGLYFEASNGQYYVGRRTYTSGTVQDFHTAQSEWNMDRLDGTGPSSIRWDATKANIYFINFEWLGVGEVQFGIIVNGVFHVCHIMKHSNVVTNVYMTIPNLPIRGEITNDGTGIASDLTVICSTVISEGGRDPSYLVRSYDRGAVPFQMPLNTNVCPLICLRYKNGISGVQALPIQISIISASTTPYRWALIMNPTFAGTALTYTESTDDLLAYNVTSTNATTITGGTTLLSGYSDKTGGPITIDELPVSFGLGQTVDGVSDILVLAICSITSKADDIYASITMKEMF